MSDRLIFVDIETFGLQSKVDPIVEVAFQVVNLDLETIGVTHSLIWDEIREKKYRYMENHYDDLSPDRQWVFHTHAKSGLWEEVRSDGNDPSTAYALFKDCLQELGVKGQQEPLCGSSVHFDRAHLDAADLGILEGFSHRNVDISSLKELCMRYNAEMFAHMENDVAVKKLHRVLPDLDDTINEFKWYYDNFLWTDRDFL